MPCREFRQTQRLTESHPRQESEEKQSACNENVTQLMRVVPSEM